MFTMGAPLRGGGAPEITFWNPADQSSGVGGSLMTISVNGRAATSPNPTAAARSIRANLGRGSGKWYFEVAVSGGTGSFDAATPGLGLATATADMVAIRVGTGATGAFRLQGNGNSIVSGASFAYGSPITSGTVMFAVDFFQGYIWAGLNGTWFASGDPASALNPGFIGVSGTLFPCFGASSSFGITATAAWKSADMAFSIPSGFAAWSGI